MNPPSTLRAMEFMCADCGCVVERGTRLQLCANGQCCCSELAIETPESFARRVTAAFDGADLEVFRKLLAANARWGDAYDPVPTCQSREQVIEWYTNARDAGMRAKVTETVVVNHQIILGMQVIHPPQPGEQSAENERWQVLTFDNGSITSIRGYETRDEAELAVAGPLPWGVGRS